jgi:hypothetical protein
MICERCGAPRTDHRAACPYCRALYAGESALRSPIVGLPPEFEIAIRKRELITAIKIYRETMRCDLKTAKEAVDKIIAETGKL